MIKDHKVHTGRHFSAGEFSFIKTNNLDPISWNHAWCTRNGIKGLLERVQEGLETDQEYTGIEIFDMANNGNEKVIAGINAFAREVATQIFKHIQMKTVLMPNRKASSLKKRLRVKGRLN